MSKDFSDTKLIKTEIYKHKQHLVPMLILEFVSQPYCGDEILT